MRVLPSKSPVRTPNQLAKAAMKQQAIKELEAEHLATEAKVTIEYMGTRYTVPATVTVKLETGQVLFYAGANGQSKLNFEPGIPGTDKTHKLAFGMGINIRTGLAIENHQAILDKYGLEVAPETEDEDLEKGESV